MPSDEIVTVKGSPVRSLQKFIESALTPAQRDSALSTLPDPWRQRLRGPILPTETVPVTVLNRLTEEAAHATGEPMEAFARRAGREAAGDAVKGIYRFFALVLTPTALLSKASQMWSSLYNCGQLRVEEQTATSARIRLIDFPSEIAGCSRLSGWIERMAQLTGATKVQVEQTQCFAKGAKDCVWVVKWD